MNVIGFFLIVLVYSGCFSISYINSKMQSSLDEVIQPEFIEKSSSAIKTLLPGTGFGDPRFSPDGTLLYQLVNDGIGNQLLLQDADGTNPRTLNLPIYLTTQSMGYQMTPDSQKFVFVSQPDPAIYRYYLYAFDRDGSNFVKLSDTLQAAGDVALTFYITSDSSRVVYEADRDFDTKNEIFSVRLDGSGLTKLNAPLTAAGFMSRWLLTSDGTKVVYLGRVSGVVPMEVFVVNVDGTGLQKVSGAMQALGNVSDFKVSQDGNWITYLADATTDEMYEIYTVASDGTSLTKVNQGFIAAGDVVSPHFGISSDGSKVFFTADPAIDGQNEVFAVDRDGNNLVQLNGVLAANRDATFAAMAPDGSKVFYVSDAGADNTWQLFSVSPDGSNRVQLFGTLASVATNAFDYRNSIKYLSAAQKVVFLADHNLDTRNDLFSVDAGGGNLVQLSPNAPAYYVFLNSVSINESKIVFLQQTSTDKSHAYTINPDGTNLIEINGSGANTANVNTVTINSGGDKVAMGYLTINSRVVAADGTFLFRLPSLLRKYHTGSTSWNRELSNYFYSESQSKFIFTKSDSAGRSNVYSSNFDGSGEILAGSEGALGTLTAVNLAPGGQVLHYCIGSQIYTSNLDGTGWGLISGAPTIQYMPSSTPFYYSSFGNYLIYLARQDAMFITELYAMAYDGTGRVKLNPGLFANGDVTDFETSPTAARLAYTAAQAVANQWDLYTVNLDGTANTKITPALPVGGGLGYNSTGTSYGYNSIFVTPDGNKILYIADQTSNNYFDAYAINWDGTGGTKLTPVSPAALSGAKFIAAAPNSQKIVIHGSLTSATRDDIYSVNIDGTGFTLLSGNMVNGGNVTGSVKSSKLRPSIVISPDSQYVFFKADKTSDEKFELFRAKLDGTSLDSLSPNLQSSGNVVSFMVTPDASKVVYLADGQTDGLNELFVVDSNGSGAKKISRSLVVGDSVLDYRITATHVAYRVKRSGRIELYLVKLDGTDQSRLHTEASSALYGVSYGYFFTSTGDKLFFSDNFDDPSQNSYRWIVLQ